MYLLLKCNLFLGYNSFFMSVCYTCLETVQVEIQETVQNESDPGCFRMRHW